MIVFSFTGSDVQNKMYQMEIQLGNTVAHFLGTFPFTQTALVENQFENRLIPPSQQSKYKTEAVIATSLNFPSRLVQLETWSNWTRPTFKRVRIPWKKSVLRLQGLHVHANWR